MTDNKKDKIIKELKDVIKYQIEHEYYCSCDNCIIKIEYYCSCDNCIIKIEETKRGKKMQKEQYNPFYESELVYHSPQGQEMAAFSPKLFEARKELGEGLKSDDVERVVKNIERLVVTIIEMMRPSVPTPDVSEAAKQRFKTRLDIRDKIESCIEELEDVLDLTE